MPENQVKTKKVTFAHGLPMGERATFTHDGEIWVAYRASKNQRIFGLVDRLLGLHAGITNEMVRWINARPGDTELVRFVLARTAKAKELQQELILEKAEVFTS